MTEEKETKTGLGFIDITYDLEKDPRIEIFEDDVIRDVYIRKIEVQNHHGNFVDVGFFYKEELDIKGRIFPLDELIYENEKVDLIVKNPKRDGERYLLDCQIYHDLCPGECLKVKISRTKIDPSFKIFNRIAGFVRNNHTGIYERAKVGTKLLVEVNKIGEGKKGLYAIVEPIKILKNEEY